MNKWRKLLPAKGGYVAGLMVASLVGGLVSAAALAAIPDVSGLIHGCYKGSGLLSNSTLRVIDGSSTTCNGSETALNWYQGGPGALLTNLAGADFSGASLPYRNFAGADLHNVIFDGANLAGSTFHGSNLSGASVRISPAHKVDFSTANLSNSTLSIDQTQANDFTGANFTNANIEAFVGMAQGANFGGATFKGEVIGDFTNIDFRNSHFVSDGSGNMALGGGASLFKNANFSGVNLDKVFIQLGDYTGANFSNTSLNGTVFGQFNFDGTTYTVISGDAPNLTGANFSNAHFVNAQMAADFSVTNVAGATWSNTRCPDGTNSDNDGGTCVGHLVPVYE